jgi:hypothetical protein
MHRFGQSPCVVMKRGALLGGQQVLAVVPPGGRELPPRSFSCTYCTAILRGLTVSAFGNVTVKIPWSIFAVIFVESIDGASS